MRHILLILFLVAASAEARAEKLPAFTDYRTEPVYCGQMARPILNSAQARSYRTRLLEAARRAPNFAGMGDASRMKILLIEDDGPLATKIARGLKLENFVVDHAANGEDGQHVGATGLYDPACSTPSY